MKEREWDASRRPGNFWVEREKREEGRGEREERRRPFVGESTRAPEHETPLYL